MYFLICEPDHIRNVIAKIKRNVIAMIPVIHAASSGPKE